MGSLKRIESWAAVLTCSLGKTPGVGEMLTKQGSLPASTAESKVERNCPGPTPLSRNSSPVPRSRRKRRKVTTPPMCGEALTVTSAKIPGCRMTSPTVGVWAQEGWAKVRSTMKSRSSRLFGSSAIVVMLTGWVPTTAGRSRSSMKPLFRSPVRI